MADITSAYSVPSPGGRLPVHCSFCGKSQEQVAKIVAGPSPKEDCPPVYICDRCVELCREVMSES